MIVDAHKLMACLCSQVCHQRRLATTGRALKQDGMLPAKAQKRVLLGSYCADTCCCKALTTLRVNIQLYTTDGGVLLSGYRHVIPHHGERSGHKRSTLKLVNTATACFTIILSLPDQHSPCQVTQVLPHTWCCHKLPAATITLTACLRHW